MVLKNGKEKSRMDRFYTTMNHMQSQSSSFSTISSDSSYRFISSNKIQTSQHQVGGIKNKPTPIEALCRAFRNNSLSLNSPFYKLNQVEFTKVLNSLASYKSCLPNSIIKTSEWCVECGESSRSHMPIAEAVRERLVCYILGKQRRVLGKMVINNAERKLIVSRLNFDVNSNLQLLNRMSQLTSASIKDRYQVPVNHTKLSDVGQSTASRLQIFGVVTAVNKVPTRTRASWHSLVCISDPSLVPTSDENNENLAPCEFKMHLFMPLLEDHPEIHRGDVVRFTNVKIESHQNRCDGRIFNKSDITVYCFPDSSKTSVPRESFEDRTTVIRVLSRWWVLNHQFFDYLTPHPIYHLHSRYPGVRSFKELSDQLVCDLYCQVVSLSEDTSDLNFFCVRDGTIFTLQERPKFSLDESAAPELVRTDHKLFAERPLYGYLALAVFDRDHWKKIQQLQIKVNDYLFMREAKVVFLTEEALTNLSAYYAFRHPCLLLRPTAEGIKKLAFSHHEAFKIRSRLHRLPQELEQMATWKLPPPATDEEPDDPLLARLNDSSVQIRLLKRLKRS